MCDYSPNPNLHFIINDLMISYILDELRAVGANEEELADLNTFANRVK